MFIETETTPNPATLKFLPGQKVMPSGTRDFASPEDAEASPLAQALFDPVMVCSECGEALHAKQVHVHAGPARREAGR